MANTSPRARLEHYWRTEPEALARDYAQARASAIAKNIVWRTGEHRFAVPYTPIPYLLERTRYEALCRDASLVFGALDRIVKGYAKDARIRAYFPHLAKYEVFLSLPVLVDPAISIARFDILETRAGQFQIVEPNTCCPGGSIWTALFYEMFTQTSVGAHMRELVREVPQPLHDPTTIYRFLTAQHAKHFPGRRDCRIMIADTSAAPMDEELVELTDEGNARGFPCVKGTIQDIEFRDGAAYVGNERIDVLYQFLDVLFRGDYAQITDSLDDIRGYLAAMRARAMLVVNPFPPIFISEDKTSLALLREPEFAADFSAAEHAAFARLVPPTYRVRDRIVEFEGERTSLMTLLRKRQSEFVIKAQMESMGRDITIGAKVSADEWERKLRSALDGPYIAQQFVEANPLTLPDPADLSRTQANFYTLALSFMGGEIQGIWNRVSPQLVTNVAQGGAVQNVVVYDDAEAR
jgi:uncharacterized circularly permuted ATP-grasp superfamily protein